MKRRESIKLNKGEVVIYKPKGGKIELKVKLKDETIWLNARQMAHVFGVNRPAVVKHINNIYKSNELDERSTCSILEQVAADGKVRRMNLYNLDMIISVGYRVNSQRATEFRIWATGVLKNYLLEGYAVNEKRLLEVNEKFKALQNTIDFLQKKSGAELLKGQEKDQIIALITQLIK